MMSNHYIDLVVLSVFLLLGAYVFFISMKRFWRLCRWHDVDARIKEIIHNKDTEAHASPVIEYEYRGQKYEVHNKKEQTSNAFGVDDLIRICVNPRRPAEFHLELRFVCAVMVLLSALFCIIIIQIIIDVMSLVPVIVVHIK